MMYLARIREAATHCDFGNAYDEMISDKFVGGLSNSKTRNSLLNKDKLTTAQAFEQASAKEAAENSSTVLGQNSVNKVSHSGFSSSSKPQFRPGSGKGNKKQDKKKKSDITCEKCTLKGHNANNCHTKCLYCKKEGHIVAMCRKKNKNVRNVEVDEGHDLDSREEYHNGSASAMNHVDVELSESSLFVGDSELPASSIVLGCTIPDADSDPALLPELPAMVLRGVNSVADAKLPASLCPEVCESPTTTCGDPVDPDELGHGEFTVCVNQSVNHVHKSSGEFSVLNSHKLPVTKTGEFFVNNSQNCCANNTNNVVFDNTGLNKISSESDLSERTESRVGPELEIKSIVMGSEKPLFKCVYKWDFGTHGVRYRSCCILH